MYKRTHFLLAVLVGLVAVTNAYKYIASIEVDGPNGQIYIGENHSDGNQTYAVLYEVDNVHLNQNGVHDLNTMAISDGSLFDAKKGNKRVLYTVFENAHTDMAFFDTPLGNAQTLTPEQRKQVGTQEGLSLYPVWDLHDEVAVLAISRDLALVNLNNLNVKARKASYYEGRIFGRNLVYNHNNQHLYSFFSEVPAQATDYGLSVDEFDLSNGEFHKVKGTYNCECETDPKDSPFYHVVFVENGCAIDYTESPARTWCASDDNRIFNFKANNLSNFESFTSPKHYDNVAWDFANRVFYGIKSGNNGGFQVHKINIDTQSFVKTFHHANTAVDTYTSKVDPTRPQLYISISNIDDAQTTQFISINTNNMQDFTIVSLNTNGLN